MATAMATAVGTATVATAEAEKATAVFARGDDSNEQ